MSEAPPLTAEQTAVVDHAGPRLFVSACPGSGKTRTVVDRFFARTRELGSKRGIAVLSFSRRATGEIRERCSKEGLEGLLAFPHYVGTLDGFFGRFVFRPAQQSRSRTRVTVLDSWDALKAKVTVARTRSPGVSLDAFPIVAGVARFDSKRLRGTEVGAKREIESNRSAWERSASRYQASLNAKGYFTCDAVRTEVRAILTGGDARTCILKALAARFEEIIVDEAQDCDEDQLVVLGALSEVGVRLVVVADPEQAIYEFRRARPDLLAEITEGMPRLELSGNWRSTSAICGLANSMRSTAFKPMTAVGRAAEEDTPVFVIPYDGKSAEAAPGAFIEASRAAGIEIDNLLLLAHRRSVALKSAGFEEVDEAGGGAAAIVARLALALAGGALRGVEVENRISSVEEMLLRRLGVETGDRTSRDACGEEELEWRWLRGAAYGVVQHVVRGLGGRASVTLEESVALVRAALELISPPGGRSWQRSSKSLVPARSADAKTHLRFGRASAEECRTTIASTIHAVKGSESAAALVVLSSKGEALDPLLEAWERREDLEAKRVAYVAVTRAARVLGVAVPRNGLERLVRILDAGGVNYRLTEIGDR